MKERMFVTTPTLGLGILATCTGCGNDGTTPVRTYTMAEKQIPITGPAVPGSDTLDNNVVAMMKKWNVPGVAIGVVKNGKLVFDASRNMEKRNDTSSRIPEFGTPFHSFVWVRWEASREPHSLAASHAHTFLGSA
jgi:hypothetical protein